jgi:hypothetical protein
MEEVVCPLIFDKDLLQWITDDTKVLKTMMLLLA